MPVFAFAGNVTIKRIFKRIQRDYCYYGFRKIGIAGWFGTFTKFSRDSCHLWTMSVWEGRRPRPSCCACWHYWTGAAASKCI